MTALEKLNTKQLLSHITDQIHRLLEVVPPDMQAEQYMQHIHKTCEEYMRYIGEKRGLIDYTLYQPQMVTQYEIHDAKNRCLLRLMDKDGLDVKFIYLRGRRKAHKIGRQKLGLITMSYIINPKADESLAVRATVSYGVGPCTIL